jgi:hypothetical protein
MGGQVWAPNSAGGYFMTFGNSERDGSNDRQPVQRQATRLRCARWNHSSVRSRKRPAHSIALMI